MTILWSSVTAVGVESVDSQAHRSNYGEVDFESTYKPE